MNAQEYWRIFLETGAPEAYLSYSRMRKMEGADVSDSAGPGIEGRTI